MSPRFVPSPHVRSVVHGDRTVLLDLRRGRYYSLDGVGTRVWELLQAGADVPAIVAQIGEEFEAPAEVIVKDVEALLQRLAHVLKVIVPVEPALPPTPSGWQCAATMLWVTFALRTLGLRRTLALAQRAGRPMGRYADPTSAWLATVVRKVNTAGAFFPGRALCLEQSLTLYVCLRRAGIGAELRIGVQPYPFAAHAWVEYRGEPVGSTHDQIGQFVPFDHLLEAR